MINSVDNRNFTPPRKSGNDDILVAVNQELSRNMRNRKKWQGLDSLCKLQHIGINSHITRAVMIVIVLVFALNLTGCAYYNYYYNARKYYREGEKSREEGIEKERSSRSRNLTNYDKCIESAGRMLKYYPNSRWEDDALLLLAKAYYRIENYRKAIGKVDELVSKYPQSTFTQEGMLIKGMSLLMVAQPDSGRLILSKLFAPEVTLELQARAYNALGEFYFMEERWETAIENFRAVIDVGAEDEFLKNIAWIKIGDCLTKTEQIDRAVDLYDEILNSKPSRKVKLEATLRRAVILRQLGRVDEAYDALQLLLHDAAYVNDFPDIELEASRCLIVMGRFEDARDDLQDLVETNKRGEMAAEANFELGLLLWEEWRDIVSARSSLTEVKKAERSSPLIPAADSLRTEMETLYRSWQRMGFLNSQIAGVDSSQQGLREFLPADTVYVDSLALITESERSKSSRSRRSKRKSKSPVPHFMEEELNAEQDSTADSTSVEIDSTLLALDSTALGNLLAQRITELEEMILDLAGFHLFKRNDSDSAAYYFSRLTGSNIPDVLWARATASLAYIARQQGDTTAYDSLYGLILERMPGGVFSQRDRSVLGYPVEEAVTDSLKVMYENAEQYWFDENNPERALEIFLSIADLADSTAEICASSLISAAYISRTVMFDDSTALELYDRVAKEFSGTPYGRFCKKISRELRDKLKSRDRDLNEKKDAFEKSVFKKDDTLIGTAASGSGTYFSMDEPYEPDRVYDPMDVDELPELMTTKKKLKNYIRRFYPDEPADEGIPGRVELEFIVTAEGAVINIEVFSADPMGLGFEEAAQDVLTKLTFKAGWYHGRMVSVRMKQLFIFGEYGPG